MAICIFVALIISLERLANLFSQVGLPAKSGVSGSLVLVIPNTMAIALWSPPLDEIGNTARGVQLSQVCFVPIISSALV